MRVGLFGGSFDPVHDAHVALATHGARAAAARRGALDPGRPALAEGAAAAPAAPIARRWCAWRSPASRASCSTGASCAGAASATRSTRCASWPPRARATSACLILGQDQYAGLHTWRDWRELLGLVTLAIANRPGAPSRGRSAGRRGCRTQTVRLPMMDISSTEVRRRVAAGLSIADLVPEAVARYIEQHRLYSRRPEPTPGAEWTFASCSASSSMVWKTSRPRTSWSSTPSTCRRSSSA